MSEALEATVVSDTVSELANPDALSHQRVRGRLEDWQKRVHALYDDIEHQVSPAFVINRSKKHQFQEEILDNARLTQDEIPQLDILRLERPVGALRALLYPRNLWIVGANGALELRLFRSPSHQSIYRIVDMSRPMLPPSKWFISPLGDPARPKLFSGKVLLSMLE